MPEASPHHDLDSLAEEFLARRRHGDRPSIEEYASRYPDLADEIRELFPTMLELEQLKVHKVMSSGGAAASIGPAPLTQLGDFRIVREVGRGGMGVVYEAIQESLHRRVALKVLGTQMGMTPRQKIRFRREAEAAARLHHTNIVPVYGVGEDRGLQFYAMQFIDGVPLNRLIRAWRDAAGAKKDDEDSSVSRPGSLTLVGAVQELLQRQLDPHSDTASREETATIVDGTDESSAYPSPLMQVGLQSRSDVSGSAPRVVVQARLDDVAGSSSTPLALTPREHRSFWNEIVRLVKEVAQGLEHAHHLGILHRDIKPANLLLDVTGAVWITDFGLAKFETQDHTLTRSGEFIGTLRYVAPEQLHGHGDTRSDVYSLGLTLFELLTLQPAFSDEPIGQILQRRTRDLPTTPRAINPLIPLDLETITLKASASDPTHRYQSAQEFADDLQRFLDDRPIRARPITSLERFWRWSRKNPMIAGLGGLSTLLVLTLIGVLGVANYQIGKSAERLQEESGIAKKSAEEAKQSAREARHGRDLADANLKLAMKAFGDITDNVASRGSPVSLVSEEDAPTLGEVVEVSPADAALLESLLEFYDRFAQQNQTDLTTEMAAIRSRIGDTLLRLGRTAEAEKSYTASVTAYETLRKSRPNSTPLLIANAKAWNRLGVAFSQSGQIMEAFGSHHQAVQLLETTTSDRESLDVQLELAQSLILADTVFIRSGLSEVMSEMFRDRGNRPPPPPPSVGMRETPRGRPEEGRWRDRPPREGNAPGRGRGPGFNRGPGSGWNRNPDDWDKGSVKAVQLLQKLWESHPEQPQVRLLLARAHRNRYYANRVRHAVDQANLDLQTAIDHMTSLGETDPTSPTYRFELADLLCLPRASVIPDSLDEETISRLERSIALSEQLLSASPTIPEYQALLGLALRRLASLHQTGHKSDIAETEYRRAIDIQRPLAARYPSTNIHQVAYVKSLAGLADLHKTQGELPEAKDCLDRAIGVMQDFLDKRQEDRWMQSFQDQLRKRRDKIEEMQRNPSAAPAQSTPT